MYKGVFAAVATPFKNGRVDLDAMKRHILWLLENGVAGVVVCATTGEGPTLKTEEYRLIVDAIAREMKGKGTLIAGAGSNSTMRGMPHFRLRRITTSPLRRGSISTLS
jgi:4-hydroxy-tetrahydrodipicolinate synthase